MRIITTLLLLLLASSVFAETYVCSFLVEILNEIDTTTYRRTADGFEYEDTSGLDLGYFDIEIIYEDSKVLVLHTTTRVNDAFSTEIAQIEKDGSNRFTFARLSTGIFEDPINRVETGTCTVVE